jgi:hypothetical protein
MHVMQTEPNTPNTWRAYLLATGILLAGAGAAVAEPPPPDTTSATPPAASATPPAPADSGAGTETAVPGTGAGVGAGAALGLIVEPPAQATPLMVFSQLEQGWRAGSPEMVIGCLSASEVEIAIDRFGPPAGRFTGAQAQFLVRDLLHYGETLGFRVTRLEWKGESPRAEAEWKHRMGATEETVPVAIELAAEPQGWRVVRIKSQ